MAASAELPRLQPCSSVPVPPPRQGVAAPGWRPPLTRLRAGNFRARIFGRARFRRFLAALDSMDVVFSDDQMRARTDHAAHNLSVLRQFVLNLYGARAASRSSALSQQPPIPSVLNSSA